MSKRGEVRNILGAYDAVLTELRNEGFTPDNYDFEEQVDMVMKQLEKEARLRRRIKK